MYGLISRALHVRQLLLHFLISGVALGPRRGSQRRFRSLSILCTIFESSSLARVSCFLMFLWVLKVAEGLFGKSLESSGDFSMRCLTTQLHSSELVLVSPPGSSQSSLLDVLDDVTAAFPSPSVSELSSLFRS